MAAAMRNFDTLRSYNTLKARGVSDVQAQALVEMIKEATESSIEHLATDAALQLTKSILSQDISNLRSELKQDIADLRSELKQEMMEGRAETALLKADVQFLKRLYFSGTAATLIGIALLFLQRH